MSFIIGAHDPTVGGRRRHLPNAEAAMGRREPPVLVTGVFIWTRSGHA